MEVILLQRVSNLGNLGTKVRVKPGFARNDLIPKGKALPATEINMKEFEAKRSELERAAKLKLQQAEERKNTLEGFRVTIPMQAGEEGRLFGSVTAYDIAHALDKAGHKISKSEILMQTGPIRQLGEHEILLNLHGNDIVAKIVVLVTAA